MHLNPNFESLLILHFLLCLTKPPIAKDTIKAVEVSLEVLELVADGEHHCDEHQEGEYQPGREGEPP